MKKILVIGCPGSGKSTFSIKLAKVLNYPVLHLDRIFHIDNYNQITREELLEKTVEFLEENETCIVDGNYSSTLANRLQYSDTVFYFDIDPQVCLKNAVHRIEQNLPREDMSPNFDNSILDPDFIEYIKTFNELVKPKIDKILEDNQVQPIKFFNYDEVDNFFINIGKL